MAHGQITHVEFPADDLERAKRFYSEIFGWQFGELEGFEGYLMFSAGSAEIGGAIGRRGESVGDRSRMYCEVDSIDEILGRVGDLGGSVALEKAEIPGTGWYASIIDSEGNEVGLYEGAGA
jgi:uncharacterized protein